MENSILISTKKILGVAANYTAFDLDILTHLNATFSNLNQLELAQQADYQLKMILPNGPILVFRKTR